MFPLTPLPLLAVVLAASLGGPSVEQDDTAVHDQITRLASADAAERSEAARWMAANSKRAAMSLVPLEKCLIGEPVAEVRRQVVLALADVAKDRGDPCPLSVIRALSDPDEYVRSYAVMSAGRCEQFADGALDLLLKAARSHDELVRSGVLNPLAFAGRGDRQALAVLADLAKSDKRFNVRHNAHIALEHATGELGPLLAYFVRLQSDPAGTLGEVDLATEDGRQQKSSLDLAIFGLACRVRDFSERRPIELAKALANLVKSRDVMLRRGASRLAGAAAWKTDFDSNGKELHDAMPPTPSKAHAEMLRLGLPDTLRRLASDDPDTQVRATATAALERFAALKATENSPPPR